jgi:hypothetical protein
MLTRIFLAPLGLLYVAIVVLDRSPGARKSTAIGALILASLVVFFLAR